jgi:protocatechuate 3,4-dioxygenase beta subunit
LVTTDSNGFFEVLSVTPGGYLGRAGHFHIIITPGPEDGMKYEPLTTQAYVCTANNKYEMNTDL